jgi:hypothetical protein
MNPFARPLPTHGTTQTQIKRIKTSMSSVGFESKISVFERAKTVHALDRAVTVASYLIFIIITSCARPRVAVAISGD